MNTTFFICALMSIAVSKELTLFTDEFSGTYSFKKSGSAQELSSTSTNLDKFCQSAQCTIKFHFKIGSTNQDLSMAGIMSKTTGDDVFSNRTDFSGFKITMGPALRLRLEVSTKDPSKADMACKYSSNDNVPTYDFVEHASLLSEGIWYSAKAEMSEEWIQLTVDDMPGPVSYNCFDNINNIGPFYIGQDVCCGNDNYKFIGNIKGIELYNGLKKQLPRTKEVIKPRQSTKKKDKIFAIIIGLCLVMVTMCILGYLSHLEQRERSELERLRKLHASHVPPWKQRGNPVYKYEQKGETQPRR